MQVNVVKLLRCSLFVSDKDNEEIVIAAVKLEFQDQDWWELCVYT